MARKRPFCFALNMVKTILFVVGCILVEGCNDHQVLHKTSRIIQDTDLIDDLPYVINAEFPRGDVRRYGVEADIPVKTSRLDSLLDLAEMGVVLQFPEGYYPIHLVFKGRQNLRIEFDSVLLGGGMDIVELDSIQSTKLDFKGQLTILDRLFLRECSNIQFEEVLVKTDTARNLFGKANRGVSLYSATDSVRFKQLRIENTGGSNDTHFKYAAAALQVHGWNSNPRAIFIDKLEVVNAGRSGVYLTGNEHIIKEISIDGFGIGSVDQLAPLEDADSGSEREFAAIWFNKCNDGQIGKLEIKGTNGRASFSLKLDRGLIHRPTLIQSLRMKGSNTDLGVYDHYDANVLIKKYIREE